MPEKKTIEKARKARREGKSPSTQAGAFVEEEMEHIREGKHGARNAKQAIAIGLSKARRAGVDLPPRRNGGNGHETEPSTYAPSPARSRATLKVLRREGRAAASHTALSRHAKAAAKSRTAAERSASARKAARTRKHK